jgi:DNA polymerase-3 subunit epsilon
MTPREKAIEWAMSVAHDPRAVVLDTETLGIKPDAGLCDIAVVAMDGLPILNTLINPGRPIPAEASDVHGIRDEDVRNAPTFADVYPDLCAVLTGRRVVIYNRAFDAAVLDACCDRYELPAFGARSWECAMLAYSDFDGTRSTNWRRPRVKWWKLGEACDAMGVRLTGAHRAMADAQATRLLVLQMAAQANTADTAEQATLWAMTNGGQSR